MNQDLSLQEISDRLIRVEREVVVIRKQIDHLQQVGVVGPISTPHSGVENLLADKTPLRLAIANLFREYGIVAVPIGVEVLRQMMSQAGLTENELSHGIIEAREVING